MAPLTNQRLLSPAELSYLHTSLSLEPPVRPDSRLPTQFRPLIAETDILPGTNGSARICFADGTEAIVGVKVEVERTVIRGGVSREASTDTGNGDQDTEMGEANDGEEPALGKKGAGHNSWVEMTIEIPGFREDDALPVFLVAMLNEALLSTGDLVDKLWINNRFHWKLYIDILLLSPPLSYPIPLLSLTTHLALLSTRLPALKSEMEEDPLFDDDWEASIYLYPQPFKTPKPTKKALSQPQTRPPITLLVIAVGPNILFDPTREELAVADAVLAVSVTTSSSSPPPSSSTPLNPPHFNLLAIRTIDPPSRTTTAGVPDVQNPTTTTGGSASEPNNITSPTTSKRPLQPHQYAKEAAPSDAEKTSGVWRPPLGGMKRTLIPRVLEMILSPKGVAAEVLAGLEGVEIG